MFILFSITFAHLPLCLGFFWGSGESCNEDFVNFNRLGLAADLKSEVYGQDLMTDIVLASLEGHFRYSSEKALVLSFHGPTGTGKNFVASKIVNSIYQMGMSSRFVRLFQKAKDFPHEADADIKEYKEKIQDAIESVTALCERSLFIFDEVHLMKKSLIDALKPYVDFNPLVGNIDYRKTIFILLSNAGQLAIKEFAINHYKRGFPRNEISYHEAEYVVNEIGYNNKGLVRKNINHRDAEEVTETAITEDRYEAFWNSELLSAHLISHTIPFLPLEISHVRKCIEKNANTKGMKPTAEFVQRVMKYLKFFPKDSAMFVEEGCKKIDSKVNLVGMKAYKGFEL